MRYDAECNEASQRIFGRIVGHLISIRDTFNLPAIDCSIADENDALITALEAGDTLDVESVLYDIDHEDEDE